MNEQQREQQTSLNEKPLWVYSGGRFPDIAGFVLILLGTLFFCGFFSATPGMLIRPFCDLLKSWFGVGAYVISALLFFLGVAIFLLRWALPRVHVSRKLIRNEILLSLAAFLVFLMIRSSDGSGSGGGLGSFLYGLIAPGPSGFVRFLLWLVFLVPVYFLLQGPRWFPAIVRSLIRLVRLIVTSFKTRNQERRERAEEPRLQPMSFDWVSEYEEAAEESEKIRLAQEKENTEPEKAADDYIEAEKMGTTSKATSMTFRTNQLPPLNLLEPELGFYGQDTDHHEFIENMEEAMEEFGTPIKVTGCSVGPSVIQYRVVPGNLTGSGGKTSKNIRVGQVAQTERDLAVRLGISDLSIQAPVPGENFIGIDIPNANAIKVRLRPLIESEEFRAKPKPLNIALGRDISGSPVVVDLGNMPHLLVAGTTNSGKSICLRSMVLCLAMNNTPEQVRMVIIDPKRVDFYRFNGLPHLLGKVETEYDRSIAVLTWAVQEMKSRYKLFEKFSARKIEVYNNMARQQGLPPLPYIVIFIDEMAEIMKGADKQGQECIDKLASLARATGMHLVVATQRPDTTIITGKIKTNIPARIALNVASAVDSRVIMGKQGAEKLLGYGDMYFIDPTQNVPTRVQGPYIADSEVDKVVAIWKKLRSHSGQEQEKAPWDEIVEDSKNAERNKDEKKLRDAIRLVCRTGKASAAYIAGKLNISSPTASRLLDRMEEMGVVGPMQLGGRTREIFWDEAQAEEYASAPIEKPDSYTDEDDDEDVIY